MVSRQRVGELGHRNPALLGPLGEPGAVELRRRHRRGDEPHRPVRVLEHRGHERLQIVFGVDDVAERGVVDAQHDRRCLAKRLAGDRARVLERDRVALLRHDAAALHEPVRQPQVAEFARAPEQQILDDAAKPGQQNRRRGHALDQVVDRRDAAVGVAGRRVESEELASCGFGRSESRCR